MQFDSILLAFVFIGALLAAAKFLRIKVKFFRKYFIPTSLIAGLIGLLLSEEVIARLASFLDMQVLSSGIFPKEVTDVMIDLPEIGITIIFASLFLGKKIPGIKKIWELAGPQIAFGQTVAWGQYVIGILLAIFILDPFFGISPMAGALIEIGFEGGPGTAAGLRSTFENIGFEEGASLALGLATSGIIAGLISGVILVNWAVRKGITKQAKKPSELSDTEKQGVYSEKDQPAGHLTTRSESIDSLTMNFVFIFLSIGVGMVLLKGLVMLENATWGNAYDVRVLEHLPLFPLALLGGVLIQVLYSRFIPKKLIDKKMMMRIQGFALDLLIVSAIATISLAGIGEYIYVFLILFVAGVSWNLFAFFFLAKKMMPDYWVERAVLDYGQSMAMTTTGLMLLQMVDPEKETPAFDSFGYKQIIFEPIVGGGLFTAASMPLIHAFGPVAILIGTGILMALWGGVGLFYFGKQKNT